MRTRILSLVGAVLLAALPADAQRDARCTTTRLPAQHSTAERAPSKWTVLDSIETDVEAAARQAGIPEPRGIVVLAIQDRTTGRAQVHLHNANVRESFVHDALARRTSLLASLPRDENTLYFRLEPMPLPDVDSVAVECFPRLRNPDRFGRAMYRIARDEGGGRPIVANLRLLVTHEGEVAYVEVLRRSGRPAVDRALVEAAQRLRFEPATVEGVPVDIWVEQPLSVPALESSSEGALPQPAGWDRRAKHHAEDAEERMRRGGVGAPLRASPFPPLSA
jgi:TonB family protein